MASGCNFHVEFKVLDGSIFASDLLSCRNMQGLQRTLEALDGFLSVIYIRPQIVDDDTKFARAVYEYSIRASHLDVRAVVMSACARSSFPTEAQLVETVFDVAVLANCFGGGVLVVGASAYCFLVTERMEILL